MTPPTRSNRRRRSSRTTSSPDDQPPPVDQLEPVHQPQPKPSPPTVTGVDQAGKEVPRTKERRSNRTKPKPKPVLPVAPEQVQTDDESNEIRKRIEEGKQYGRTRQYGRKKR